MDAQKFEAILNKIEAKDTETKVRGWNELAGAHADAGAGGAGQLDPWQFQRLCGILVNERDAEVRIAAAAALIPQLQLAGAHQPKPVSGQVARELGESGDAASPGDGKPRSKSRSDQPKYLGDWFWRALAGPQPGFVFGLSDPSARRRDEDALIQLGRFLPYASHPHVDFQAIWMSEPDIESVLGGASYNSVVLIGRLNLYGPVANERWSNPYARYTYPDSPRPGVAAGALCPEWQKVIEHQPRSPDTEYVARETTNGGSTCIRTDYAVVQRYSKFDGLRWVNVLLLSGGSTLGTLGAVMWATKQLLEPVRDGIPIRVPPDISDHSCLEALLEIQAPVTRERWKPRPAKLLKLNVDRASWDMEANDWHIAPPVIRLVERPGDRETPSQMLFDGRPAPLNPRGEAYRILTRLCEAALKNPPQAVSLAALAGGSEKGRPNSKRLAKIERQLRTIGERHLKVKDGIISDGVSAQLGPSVIVERTIARSA